MSPLVWANTRRTFEGGKLMWQSDNWHVDGFWTRPLRRFISKLDTPSQDQQFYGMWGTYRGFEKDFLDVYWLASDNDEQSFRCDLIWILNLRVNGAGCSECLLRQRSSEAAACFRSRSQQSVACQPVGDEVCLSQGKIEWIGLGCREATRKDDL